MHLPRINTQVVSSAITFEDIPVEASFTNDETEHWIHPSLNYDTSSEDCKENQGGEEQTENKQDMISDQYEEHDAVDQSHG